MTTHSLWLDATLLLLLAVALLSLRRLPTGAPQVGGGTAGQIETAAAKVRAYYRRLSRQAGFDPDRLRWVYWAAKLALMALLPLLLLELAASRSFPAPALISIALTGFVVPDLWLLVKRRERRQRIRATLSYFLDLLVALVHSGTTIENAFERAGRGIRKGRAHPLADEVALIAEELDLGKDRAAAFHALAERTGVVELKALSSALTIGLRLGSSVESILTSQADILRARQHEEALKRINRAGVQAIVPTMLCGFPILLLLLLFPAVLEILEAFQLLKSALP